MIKLRCSRYEHGEMLGEGKGTRDKPLLLRILGAKFPI